jgi:N6-adenosine-specific RNA methylase IME4
LNIHTITEYAELVPPLTDEEYNSLKQSIKENGQQLPILVNNEGVVLDGHHRFKICDELKITPKHKTETFENKLYEKLFVIDSNLQRRQLNKFQRTELHLVRQPILKEIAEKNQKAGVKLDTSGLIKPEGKDGVNEKIGKLAKVGHDTVRKVKNIKEKGTKEIIDKVRSGQLSISYAAKMVNNTEAHKEKNIPELPQGQFDIILADPPWSYDFNIRGSPDDHYIVMKDSEIKEMQVPSSDNAMLFLWATLPKLPEAIAVLKAWGFKYKTGAVWVKDKIGTGYYFRGQAELLLVGEKGDMPTPQEKDRQSSVIEAPRGQHSEKPDKVYNMIESMYPNRQYLELFARKKHSDLWTAWGNELKQ